MKRAILVHNPTAGEGRHSAQDLLALLRQAGFRARHIDAKKKKEMRSLERARGLVVVAGGDGTVHKVAKRVLGRGVTLAIIPLGTANNIARSLGIAGTARELIRGIKRARRIEIDVGVAKGPWGKRLFIEGAGGGLFADVMASLDSRRPRRKRANGDGNHVTRFSRHAGPLEPALHALAECLPDFKAKASEVTIDGTKISGAFLLLEAMNMPYLGPNLHLGPDANPSDGVLDFVLLRESQRAEFQGYLAHRLDGGRDAPMLTVHRGKQLQFAWRGSRLHVDDKVLAVRENGARKAKAPALIKIRVKPAALQFLVPPGKKKRPVARRRMAAMASPRREGQRPASR